MIIDTQPAFNGEGLDILLVEDDPESLKSLDRLLRKRNFNVVSAASAASARELFPTQRFTLMISDIGLPDGTGYQLMQEFGRGQLVGIALTGYGMTEDVAAAHAAGFSIHLTKPVRMRALDQALANAVQVLRAMTDE